MVHHLHFVPSCLNGGIRRSWWRGNIFISSTRIRNRHFPTWKIKILPPITFAAAPLFFFQIPSAYNHRTPRIDHASGLEISCLFCTLVYAFHIQQHTKQLYISQLHWRIRFPVFVIWELLGPERFLRDAMYLLGLHAQFDSFYHLSM